MAAPISAETARSRQNAEEGRTHAGLPAGGRTGDARHAALGGQLLRRREATPASRQGFGAAAGAVAAGAVAAAGVTVPAGEAPAGVVPGGEVGAGSVAVRAAISPWRA